MDNSGENRLLETRGKSKDWQFNWQVEYMYFQNEKPIYKKVLEGFEKHYGQDVVLKLLHTIYGLKQAARAFWRKLTAALNNMRYKQSPADPCLFFVR